MSYTKLSVSALALAAMSATTAAARDQISIVGSSTVFPYTQAVAEQFSNNTGAPSPIVESTGTGGGMQIFCEGIGESHPDLTGASRAMKASEWAKCEENGVTDITEAMIGYDGLSIGVSRDNDFAWDLSLEEIYLALGAEVPVDGEWVDNPYTKWSEINADLPETEILVLGPPPTSGTRDAFVELVMEEAAEEFPEIKSLDKAGFKQVAHAMREDGAFIEAGENDNLIVQKLEANPVALGIFGFSFLDQNADKLQGATVEGVEPTFENIASGDYGVSRSLFVYAKKEHVGVIPGMEEFIAEYTSEAAWGPEGYLADKGLIPLPEADRAAQAEEAKALKGMGS
jgi:phosphate transport system substrate-binding protein